jgi:xanthine/CO dehydrogenase XdhC/CoxF family maturation factor
VSMWLSTGGALALARLAYRYGITQRELIERMVLAEDERVLATIHSDSPEWDSYFARKPLHAIPEVFTLDGKQGR